MLLIFILSSQVIEESNQLSTGISGIVENTVGLVTPDTSFDTINFNYLVRKGMHFLAYFILGILISISFRRSKLHIIRNLMIALFLCILFAISDEVHQMFVAGRGPRISDIYIDSVGAMAGITVYLLAVKLIYLKKQRS